MDLTLDDVLFAAHAGFPETITWLEAKLKGGVPNHQDVKRELRTLIKMGLRDLREEEINSEENLTDRANVLIRKLEA